MEKKVRFSVIYFVIAFVALLVVQQYFLVRDVETISYSEFKTLLKDRLVNDLSFTKETVEGKFEKDGQERLISLRNEKDSAKLRAMRARKHFTAVRMEDA